MSLEGILPSVLALFAGGDIGSVGGPGAGLRLSVVLASMIL